MNDLIPISDFVSVTFDNVAEKGFIYLPEPSPGLATIDNCGEFTCTAAWNTMITFKSTRYTGSSVPRSTIPSF